MKKKMTKTLAKKIFDQYNKVNVAVPDLNNGGCGVFACLFAEKMKLFGFEAKVIELAGDGIFCNGYEILHERFESNNKKMHEAASKKINPDTLHVQSADHFCTQVDDFYFDSMGFYESENGRVIMGGHYEFTIVGEVDLKDMEYISLKNRGHMWNSDYSANENKKIEKIINSIEI